jgi:hypothetical protein
MGVKFTVYGCVCRPARVAGCGGECGHRPLAPTSYTTHGSSHLTQQDFSQGGGMMVLGYCINVCTPELGWSQAQSASQMPNPRSTNNLLQLLQGKCMVPTCSAGVQGWGACSREVYCIQLGACKPRGVSRCRERARYIYRLRSWVRIPPGAPVSRSGVCAGVSKYAVVVGETQPL